MSIKQALLEAFHQDDPWYEHPHPVDRVKMEDLSLGQARTLRNSLEPEFNAIASYVHRVTGASVHQVGSSESAWIKYPLEDPTDTGSLNAGRTSASTVAFQEGSPPHPTVKRFEKDLILYSRVCARVSELLEEKANKAHATKQAKKVTKAADFASTNNKVVVPILSPYPFRGVNITVVPLQNTTDVVYSGPFANATVLSGSAKRSSKIDQISSDMGKLGLIPDYLYYTGGPDGLGFCLITYVNPTAATHREKVVATFGFRAIDWPTMFYFDTAFNHVVRQSLSSTLYSTILHNITTRADL